MVLSRSLMAGVIAALLAGLVAGAGSAWLATGQVNTDAGRGPAPWKTMAGTGTAAASPQQRATVARVGIWALPDSEVIYFTTETDSQGEPLRATCDYTLEAEREPRARWWSIGVYRDYFWIDNPANRYSLTSSTITRDAAGGYRVSLSGGPMPGNWLPLGTGEGRITLLFRLYQPHPDNIADPVAVPLPAIRRMGCRA
jgi:hypothetical protein